MEINYEFDTKRGEKDFTFEPEETKVIEELCKLLSRDYFGYMNEENKSSAQIGLKKFITDLSCDAIEELEDGYFDELKDAFEEKAREQFDNEICKEEDLKFDYYQDRI